MEVRPTVMVRDCSRKLRFRSVSLLIVMLWSLLMAQQATAAQPTRPDGFAGDAVPAPRPAASPGRTVVKRPPLFESDVLPIFRAKCTKCHNARARKAELDLSSLGGVMKGSESGDTIEKSKPDESLLFQMIDEGDMPPKGNRPLTAREKEVIRQWIAGGARSARPNSGGVSVTQHDIIPIMNLRCTVCHGLRRQEAGLDLRTRASMLKGGKSGPAIVPGHPEQSLVLKRIAAREMPPRDKLVRFGVRPIEPPEVAKLTAWISAGAPDVSIQPDVATTAPDPLVTDKDRQFWAFQTPQRPPIPTVTHRQRVRNPIDAFVLEKLEAKNLSLSPEADRLTLIRRVAFDLTGLPPRWRDVERYLADRSPDAYEQMVDRYLASPQYGERWAQYWLDLAGYADSEGKRSADVIRRYAWRYRDYVVRAFSEDKPYDRFLLEQIAGDELADYEHGPLTPDVENNLVATGFLRMAPDGTGSDIVNTVVERMEVVSDEINVLSSTVLALTIKCAQCHSHKYDPIPQRDYYRLVAVFKGAYDVHDWLKSTSVRGQTKSKAQGRILPLACPAELQDWQRRRTNIDRQIARLKADLETVRKRVAKKHPGFGKRDLKRLDSTYRKLVARTARKIKTLETSISPRPGIRALWDRGVPSPTYIFRRGEATNPGRLVGPGVPSVLTDGRTPFVVQPPWPGAKQTGRRLALARWLVAANHPLTARVMVNRLWEHHFGRGIVKTTGDFGHTGSRPSNQKLLDWLAREFVARGWSIKAMQRLMLFSATYRQVSTITPERERLDPENVLVSRMPLVRMQAEVVRDSILAAASALDDRRFGTPDAVTVRADGLVTSVGTAAGWRRSIYVRHRRKEMPTILENFDLPQMIPNCIERSDSTVASQALHLMNDGLIRRLADRLADRVIREASPDSARQIERVYQIALSRRPTVEERSIGQQALDRLTAHWADRLHKQKSAAAPGEAERRALANFCHTIINSAAFLYVD